MKIANYEKMQPGDLVQVPYKQFAPMRRGWSGWLFGDAVVLRKTRGKKSNRPMVVVKMRTTGGRNDYRTVELTFYAEYVFQTNAAENAKRFMDRCGVTTREDFYSYIQQEDVKGCDWVKFLVDNGFVF